MPATRSILSVIRLMLEANLPQAEILRTLDACLAALPSDARHPLDQAPAIGALSTADEFAAAARRDNGDSGDIGAQAARAVEYRGL